MKKIKVTVGIPAINEEANIRILLEDILSQNTSGFVLDQIIVASDGSTDNTVAVSRKVGDKRIIVIDNKEREGQGERQNQIMKMSKSDILVLLNADIRIPDVRFIYKLIEPILNRKVGLTSAKLKPTNPRSFFEKVLCLSEEYKNSVFEQQHNGNNLHTCHGGARALSKRLYSKLHFKRSIAEDAYSYFFCISNGYKFKYVKDAIAYYTLPDNLRDHIKRSQRYFNSANIMRDEFGNEIVDDPYKLSFAPYFINGLKSFIKNPLHMAVYVLITIFIRIRQITINNNGLSDKWELSKSTKGVSI